MNKERGEKQYMYIYQLLNKNQRMSALYNATVLFFYVAGTLLAYKSESEAVKHY